jgi:hypothetical protein
MKYRECQIKNIPETAKPKDKLISLIVDVRKVN